MGERAGNQSLRGGTEAAAGSLSALVIESRDPQTSVKDRIVKSLGFADHRRCITASLCLL